MPTCQSCLGGQIVKHIGKYKRPTYIHCQIHGKVEMPDTVFADDVTMFCIKCEEELREIENDIKQENKYANYIYE